MQEELANKERTARVKCVSIHPQFILDLMKCKPEGLRVGEEIITAVGDPIPLDAKVLRCGTDTYGNMVLILEDASFDPVPEGCPPPQMVPTYNSAPVSVIARV